VDAIRMQPVHRLADPKWPENSEFYRLESPDEVRYAVLAQRNGNCVAVRADRNGDVRTFEYEILAVAKGTTDYEKVLNELGYCDIFDEYDLL
jgi:hypothetical protein